MGKQVKKVKYSSRPQLEIDLAALQVLRGGKQNASLMQSVVYRTVSGDQNK
jgi:hypothetical protein